MKQQREDRHWTMPADQLAETMHVSDVAHVAGIDRRAVDREVAAGRLPAPLPGEPRVWRTRDVLDACGRVP